MPCWQKTRTSDEHDLIASPQPFKVTKAPERVRAITVPRISTGVPRLSSQAATSTKSSPTKSVTVLSMWAPVSNRKPPPAITGSCRQAPVVASFQFCQTVALTFKISPKSPERNMRTAVRTWGERLPLNETTSRRPVLSRVLIKLSASPAFITIGFSSNTSMPASKQAWA